MPRLELLLICVHLRPSAVNLPWSATSQKQIDTRLWIEEGSTEHLKLR